MTGGDRVIEGIADGFGLGYYRFGELGLGVGVIRGLAIWLEAVDGREFWSKDYGSGKWRVRAVDFVSGG